MTKYGPTKESELYNTDRQVQSSMSRNRVQQIVDVPKGTIPI